MLGWGRLAPLSLPAARQAPPGISVKELPAMGIQVVHNVPYPVEMSGHAFAVPTYLDGKVLPGFPVSIVAVELAKIGVGNTPAEPHTHDRTEVYLLPDYGADKARIKVCAEGREEVVESPALVIIPAGLVHQFVVLDASPGQMIFGIFTDVEPH